MLVLTRCISQSILIDDERIKVTILGVQGTQVRLGIEADTNISVDREEIAKKKRDNGE